MLSCQTYRDGCWSWASCFLFSRRSSHIMQIRVFWYKLWIYFHTLSYVLWLCLWCFCCFICHVEGCFFFNLNFKVYLLYFISESRSVTPWTDRGILQARILEWVAFFFSSGSSQPRNQTLVYHIAGGFFTSWVPRGSPFYDKKISKYFLLNFES